MNDFVRELELALATAREAGALLREGFDREQEVGYKGRIDLVTQRDLKSERLIVERLRAAFPGDDIWAEEGSGERRGADRLWIVDPLDGTTNYAHGYPVFAFSIALRVEGRLAAGVVYNPLLDEMYAARRGGGTTLNGRARRVTSVAGLERAMLATGFPYDIQRDDPEQGNIAPFARFVVRAQAVRRAGSAALAIANVAVGRTDAFWERGLHAWDMAAAALLVEEAGGRVTDYEGRPLVLEAGEIVATNGPLHGPMLDVLRLGGGRPGPSESGEPPPPDTMRRYVLGFLFRAENPPPISEAEADEIQRQHLAYMSGLYRRGILILAGPFLDRTDLRGICLYALETVEEARALGEQDPAVRAGRLRFEYHPWYGAKGIRISPEGP
jgi:myo-inositol-1(or 4)-monophosphatase